MIRFKNISLLMEQRVVLRKRKREYFLDIAL
jgi:hypothetical protein